MKKSHAVPATLVFLLVVIIGLAFNTYRLMKQVDALKKDPQIPAKAEIKELVGKLSKLVILPQGEDPVVATVNDKKKLKDQPIFAKAENGDKILIYSKAKKAYIYSPAKNMIIDVVAVNIDSASSTPTITGVSAENPIKVALYNGTTNLGVTNTLEKRIKDARMTGVSVVIKETAKKTNYTKTVVVDVNGLFADQASQLATLLNAEVVSLPVGEVAPKADVLVIVGEDFK